MVRVHLVVVGFRFFGVMRKGLSETRTGIRSQARIELQRSYCGHDENVADIRMAGATKMRMAEQTMVDLYLGNLPIFNTSGCIYITS